MHSDKKDMKNCVSVIEVVEQFMALSLKLKLNIALDK